MNTIEIDGCIFTWWTERDDDNDAPWERCDCFGIVSDWTSREKKRPGEKVLQEDRGHYRLYDWAATMKLALCEGWGIDDEKLVRLEQHLGRKATRKEIVEAAVQGDFEFLQGWCNNEWHYIGVVVKSEDTGEISSLWGIENEEEAYQEEVAQNLARELLEGAKEARRIRTQGEMIAQCAMTFARRLSATAERAA